jgi:folate-binding protein YgfZ
LAKNLRCRTWKSFMTETNLAANLSTTPLATLLGSSALLPDSASATLAAYRGALTPRILDAPEKEMAALVTGAAVHDLGWLRRVAVHGEDRFRWLSGMVTNTVSDLKANTGAWNLVCNAAGRIQGELYVWRLGSGGEDDELELEIAADQEEKLLAHLDQFIIMDDVQLVRLNAQSALGLSGPMAGDLLAHLGLPATQESLTSLRAVWNGREIRIVRSYGVLAPHYELWVEAAEIASLWMALKEAGATPVGTRSLEALRIAEGIPAYGIDMIERDLPQETSQMRALHFSKGCYLGQEIVERIRARGSVHRQLRLLELDGPLPAAGTELMFHNAAGVEAAAGVVTSAAELPLTGVPTDRSSSVGENRRFALGMIRAEAELRNQPFTYAAGAATGTARILAGPPALMRNGPGEQYNGLASQR